MGGTGITGGVNGGDPEQEGSGTHPIPMTKLVPGGQYTEQ